MNKQKLIEGLNLLGIKFQNLDYYVEAFMHKTYINEHKNNNHDLQRLEFFGDAILSFVIAKHLFHKFPTYDEGKLTQLRLNLVEESALANFSRKLNLGDMLFLGKGAEMSNFRNLNSLLCDVFESFIAAIYLDLGLEEVEKFIVSVISDCIIELKDPKSKLQELVQAEARTIEYNLVMQEGPSNKRVFTYNVVIDGVLYGTGRGQTKKAAEKRAAIDALSKLA